MKKMQLVKGKYVIPAYDRSPIENGCVVVEGNRVVEVGKYGELKGRFQGVEELGDGSQLVIPGLVNAHSHGRGLSDFQRGAIDNTLETWLWSTRTYIPISAYDDIQFSAIRLVESGVTSTMHNHILKDPIHYEEEFSKALRAYQDIGMRVSFCPAIRNQNLFVYGDNESFLRTLPEEIGKMVLPPSGPRAFSEEKYFNSLSDLIDQYASEKVRISFGPLAPQWCTDDLLKRMKREADERGIEIHIHALQTLLQKIYGLKTYGKSLIEHMKEIGILGKNLSIGHCVFPTLKDIDLLAESGTSVSHHPSCNLRERNGISPVYQMIKGGVRVGIGLDGKGINDDDDFIQEMRMVYLLHRLSAHELDSSYLSSRDIFKMATVNGAEILGFGDEAGRLEKGRLADIVILDLDRIFEPYIDSKQDLFDVFLYRAKGSDVNTVLINGELVMREKELLKVDKKNLSRRIREEASREWTLQEKAFREATEKLRIHLRDYYKDWYRTVELEPYYIFNSRK